VIANAGRALLVHTGDGSVAEELRTSIYVGYLRRLMAGPAAVGSERSEMVSDGCGRTTQVTITVCAVADGRQIGPETDIESELADGERTHTLVTSLAR
jgi:hypothetical protein